MSQRSIWDVLGIEATDDERELKRAYARRLKLTHPEDDPEGFQELRAAYDLAQRHLLHRRYEAYEAAVEAAREAPQPEGELAVSALEPETQPQSQPEPEPEPPPTVVEIVQPLPDRPMTEEERFNAAFQAEVDALHADVAEMRAMLQAKPIPAIAVRRLFEKLLVSPALDNLAVAGSFEPWIEEVLIADLPASDLLIPVAIDHFGWTADEDRRFRRVGDMALARENDLHVFRQLGRKSHSQNAAFRALTTPPTRWNRLRWQATVGLEERVLGLLSGIQTDRPGLVQNLNAEAVAWWEAAASRPRIGLAAALALLVLPFVALLAMAPDGVAGWWPISLLLTAALGGAYFYGVVKRRIAWRGGEAEKAPPWQRHGWALLGLLLPAAGAAALVSGIDVRIGVILLWIAGLVGAGWARVTAEPAFPALTDRTAALVGFQRTLLGLGRFGYLMAMWLVVALYAPDDRWLLMLIAGLGSALVFLTGGGSLQDIVERIEPRKRTPYYVPLATGLFLTAVLFVVLSKTPAAMPWIGAMVGAVGLLDVALDRVLSEDQRTRRAWLTPILLLASWMGNSMMHGEATSPIGVFGVWVLLQSIMTLWQASRQDSGQNRKSIL